jgi:CheY-like chemotaxis protein
MARYVIIKKSAPPSACELGERWVTIGRADGNTFQIVDISISARHCEARVKDGVLTIRDLQSTNGTFIGSQRISEAVIQPGETFRAGEVELHFEASTAPEAGFNTKMLMTNMAALAAANALATREAPTSVTMAGQSPEAGLIKKFQVLLVDDSMAFLETFGELCGILSNSTWEVHCAVSADRTLAILPEKPMDLVILDVGLPMMDGLQLLGIIHRRYPAIKLAVMTGNATEAKRTDALANGAELFLEKPVSAQGIQSVFNLLNDLLSWPPRGENVTPETTAADGAEKK